MLKAELEAQRSRSQDVQAAPQAWAELSVKKPEAVIFSALTNIYPHAGLIQAAFKPAVRHFKQAAKPTSPIPLNSPSTHATHVMVREWIDSPESVYYPEDVNNEGLNSEAVNMEDAHHNQIPMLRKNSLPILIMHAVQAAKPAQSEKQREKTQTSLQAIPVDADRDIPKWVSEWSVGRPALVPRQRSRD